MIIKIAAFTALGLLATMPHGELVDLAIGAKMPAADVAMMDVSGKKLTLKDAAGPNGTLVIFSCNTCPFVIGTDGSAGWEGRYPELAKLSESMGVGMVMINSNAAKRDAGDSFADMQTRYKSRNLGGAYVLDEGNKVADAFGARTTPHVFLFNNKMELVYKGAIDDNVGDPAAVKEHWLQNAMTNLSKGVAIDPATTRNTGCSIKRVAHEH